MGLIVRIMLLIGGGLASLVMATDSENFVIAQALFGILAVTLLLLVVVLIRRR